jgi:hypothetical protein
MAFLGDFGKFFGLGSSEQVLGDVGASFGSLFGPEGAIVGKELGKATGRATSNLAGDDNISPLSTADQAYEQSAVPISRRGDIPSETSTMTGTTGMANQQAFIGGLGPAIQGIRTLAPSIGRFFGSPGGSLAIGTGTGLVGGALTNMGMRRDKPVLTQSRRNKARIRQLVNFMGLDGAAQFLSQASGQNVAVGDVVALLLRTFRNDGAYITKAQVRNLRRTTNKFKSLEKQVKEATSMSRTSRRAPMRRGSSTTLIKN